MVKLNKNRKIKSKWYVRRGNCHVKTIKTFAQKAEVFMFNRDIEAKKMEGSKEQLKFIDLFAGIGGIRIAFERAGARCVLTSEWDKACQQTYEANFGEKAVGDITKIDAKDVPDHDILTAGFPCQTFSIIGERQGFADTRGTLFFEVERIISVKRPKAFLLENVKQLVTHDKGRTFKIILQKLDKLGYFIHYKILNGLDFGVPQKRERIIIVGFNENFPFRFPSRGNGKVLTLDDILEPDEKVDKKHFLSDYMLKKLKEKVPNPPRGLTVWHENKAGNIGIHKFSCALRANGSYNYLMVSGKRRLTPREMLRLQGYPDSFKIVVNDSEARKQAGNSVVIPKIEAVAKAMIEALNQKPIEVSIQSDLFSQNKLERIYAAR
jgi:DNA (cytosine-5)-methyltransferase 1